MSASLLQTIAFACGQAIGLKINCGDEGPDMVVKTQLLPFEATNFMTQEPLATS